MKIASLTEEEKERVAIIIPTSSATDTYRKVQVLNE